MAKGLLPFPFPVGFQVSMTRFYFTLSKNGSGTLLFLNMHYTVTYSLLLFEAWLELILANVYQKFESSDSNAHEWHKLKIIL